MNAPSRPAYERPALLIGGEWIEGASGGAASVRDPASGAELAQLPMAGARELDLALHAAGRAFEAWRAMPAYDRYRLIRDAAALLRGRAEAIGTVLTLEQGKTLADAVQEVRTSADVLDWYAEEGRRAYGRVIPGRTPGARMLVMREPVGPVAAFTPWNFPALTPARKIGGALAAGCSLVLKAAEETPGTAIAMARCFQDAGLPAGVLNLVFGDPARVSEHLLASRVIRKVSFTGSVAVGKHLQRLAAGNAQRCTLELGGHAPVLVFDDANVKAAAALLAAAKYRNAGQICVSPTRFFVQRGVYDEFVEHFGKAAAAVKVGPGLLPGTTMGPVANRRRLEAVTRMVDDAIRHGASVVAGGGAIDGRGLFFEATALANVPLEATAMREEPFGPLALIAAFGTVDEAVELANRLPYGLASYVFTSSLERASRVAARVEAGMVAVNTVVVGTPETPFGGVKDSGYGSEGGVEGLDAYLVTKFVNEVPAL